MRNTEKFLPCLRSKLKPKQISSVVLISFYFLQTYQSYFPQVHSRFSIDSTPSSQASSWLTPSYNGWSYSSQYAQHLPEQAIPLYPLSSTPRPMLPQNGFYNPPQPHTMSPELALSDLQLTPLQQLMPIQVHYHKPRTSVLVSSEVALSNHQSNLLWQEPLYTPQLVQLSPFEQQASLQTASYYNQQIQYAPSSSQFSSSQQFWPPQAAYHYIPQPQLCPPQAVFNNSQASSVQQFWPPQAAYHYTPQPQLWPPQVAYFNPQSSISQLMSPEVTFYNYQLPSQTQFQDLYQAGLQPVPLSLLSPFRSSFFTNIPRSFAGASSGCFCIFLIPYTLLKFIFMLPAVGHFKSSSGKLYINDLWITENFNRNFFLRKSSRRVQSCFVNS